MDNSNSLTRVFGDIVTVDGEDETGYEATAGYKDIRVKKTACELLQDGE